MGRKNLVLSLIFPVICCLFSIIPTLFSFQFAAVSEGSALFIAAGSFSAAAGLFPIVAVILGKTDISPTVKWQAMFTASAAVPVLAFAVIANIAGGLPVFLSVFFMIIAPLAFTVAAGITYGKIFYNGGSAVLKWFTAFLSTPLMWYFLSLLLIAAAIGEKLFKLSWSGMG